MNEKVIVKQTTNKVVVQSPGPQGPRGRTILNGSGVPAGNLGLEGDFYYDTTTSRFYGPKPNDLTWDGAQNYLLNPDTSIQYSWDLAQVTGPEDGVYSVVINHNLEMWPNVTIKTSGGHILETGIDYNSTNQITLKMAQPFSGTAYLS